MGACKGSLNSTMTEQWKPWLDASERNRNVSYTVVNAPSEHIRDRENLQRLEKYNKRLAEDFAAGAFPQQFRLFDWAKLTRRLRPATVAPIEGTTSWHYACQYYRHYTWYSKPPRHNLTLVTHPAGDCTESGATPLWDAVL